MKKYFASCLIFLILFLPTGCLKQDVIEDVYKVAVVAPLTGTDPALGESVINGAELAVKEANEEGGIERKKLVLIKEDDGGLVGEGAFFAYRLTRTDMVLGVIGHLDSDISIPASEFYARAMIPQITPGSTSPYFTERKAVNGYVFRTIGRDDTQGKILADYIIKNGFKRVAILHNGREYGRSLAGELAKSLKVNSKPVLRPEIVFYNKIERGKKDYGALLSQISFVKPDIVFLAGEYNDAGYLVKDFSKYGLTSTKFIGGDGVYHNEFIQIGGKRTEGAVVISAPPIVNKEFVTKYKKHFQHEPTGYSANTYDATNILISAIRKVKEKSPEKIAMEVAKTNHFNGVTGVITFDKNGDLTTKGFVLNKVVNGKFEVIENGNT
ncbi:MAG: branched-chain amino acid ABC transporter substrate-binding protein [Candidatus Melainabacteria bacterium]|nr:branched-chain amino acid ABC transporter substrate-binding protein [Candidatus Melainabacteria bacterium]